MERPKKEGNLLLLFVFFFLIASFYFLLSDSLQGEEMSSASSSKGSLFLSADATLESPANLTFSNSNYVFASSPPYLVKNQVLGVRGLEERDNIISYKVEPGDTFDSIAEKFDISTDTIKWANDLKNGSLKKDDELLILPITGVIYYVERRDTVGRIAQIHKAKSEDIIDFNNIKNNRITAGERLIIPGGTPPPPPRLASPSSSPSPSTPVRQSSRSSFVNPVPGGVITQRLHSYNAIDIGNPCGTPLLAAASGRVVQTGRGTWPAGNFVKIDHGVAIILYAHVQDIYVNTGSYVTVGQQIGTVGNTGKTVGRTGCHLHFDVLSLSIRNPFAHLPVGSRP